MREIKAIDFVHDKDLHDVPFRVKGGKVRWESIVVSKHGVRCEISRVVQGKGKSWIMGLNFISKFISFDTILIPEQ